jgi:phage-related protein
VALGREVADAYISVHGDLGPFRRDLTRARAAMARANKQNEQDNEKSWGRVGKAAEGALSKVQGSWRRMDSTVRLVLGLIAAGADQMAVLGSGLAGAGTALASSLGMALVNAIPLAATLPGIAYGIGLAVASIKQIIEQGGPVADALKGINKAFEDVQVPAFTKQWEGALKDFALALTEILSDPAIPTALGKQFAEITRAFTSLLKSPEMTEFRHYMTQELARSVGNLGKTIANVLRGMLSLFNASAETAEKMTAAFEKHTRAWANSMREMRMNGTLEVVFERAYASGAALMRLTGAMSEAIGHVFMIGSVYGDRMINDLSALIERFNVWSQTAQGQKAINQWFADGVRILYAMKPVVVGLAQAMSILVTERAISQWEGLNAALGHALPQLATLLNVIGGLDILGNLARLIDGVTSALAVLAPPLDQIAVVLGNTLGAAVFAASKALAGITGALLAPIQALVPGFEAAGAILSHTFLVLGDVVAKVAGIIGPTLVPVMQAISATFVALQAPVNQIVSLVGAGLVAAFQALAPTFQVVGQILAAFVGALGSLVVALQPAIALVGTMFSGALSNLAPVINTLFQQIGATLIPIFYEFARTFTILSPRFAELAGIVVQFVSGALAQLGPAIGQLGPIFGQLTPILGAIGRMFIAMLPTLSLIGHAFLGMLPSIMQIGQSLLAALMPALASLLPMFTALAPMLVQLVMQFVMLASGALPVVAQLFSQLMTVITPLIPMVMQFVTIVLQLAMTFLSQLLPALLPIITTLGTGLMAILQVLAPIFFQIISAVGQLAIYFISNLLPAILPLFPVIQQLIAALVTFLVPAFQVLGNIISAVMPVIMAIIKGVIDNVIGVVNGFVQVLRGVATFLQGVFTGDVGKAFQGIGQIISGAVQFIWNLIQLWFVGRAIGAIKAGLAAAKGTFTSIWNSIVSFLQGAMSRITSFISSGISGARNVVSGGVSAIRSFFVNGFNAARDFVTNAVTGMANAVSGQVRNILGFVGTLPWRITGILSGLAGRLLSMGAQAMMGFANGISSMAGELVNRAMAAVGGAIDAVKRFLNIGSPSKLMYQISQWTWQGFINGGDAMQRGIARASEALAAKAVSGFDRSKMYVEGRNAASGLADGLLSQKALVSGALNTVVPNSITGKTDPLRINVVGAQGVAPEPAGSPTIFEEGAIQFQTAVQDPQTAAKQLMDLLARESKAG